MSNCDIPKLMVKSIYKTLNEIDILDIESTSFFCVKIRSFVDVKNKEKMEEKKYVVI